MERASPDSVNDTIILRDDRLEQASRERARHHSAEASERLTRGRARYPIWALANPEQLSKDARTAIEDPANDVLFSAASIWEIAIKASLKRADFRVSPEQVTAAAIESSFRQLPVNSAAAAHTAKLPAHHRDPFDRLLIAQAITEPAVFYTADVQLEVYSELVHRL